jgi:hypothetical protein
MQDPHAYRLLADAVLLLHFAVVAFVVGGLFLVLIGNMRHWRWVNALSFRVVHLVAIGVVVVQAWLGKLCPLTILESWLRGQGGEAAYTASFIEHWVQRVLYYEAPLWVFTLAYTAFGLLVIAAWWYFPPRSNAPPSHRKEGGFYFPREIGSDPISSLNPPAKKFTPSNNESCVYSPIILTSTRFLRRPSNSP